MASLNDICYEQIKDNFYYGLFGDFKLVVDKNTGCFNATKLCNDGGKKFTNWSRLEKSKRLLEYYRSSLTSGGSTFYEVKGDNQNELVSKTTGQYVQKELILDIASWLSVDFYDKCNKIIVDFFVSEFKTREKELQKLIGDAEKNIEKLSIQNRENEEIIKIKDDRIDHIELMLQESRDMLRSMGIEIKDIKEQNNDLLHEVGELREDNNELQEHVEDIQEQVQKVQVKLDISVEDRAPQPNRLGRKERFMLIKRNDEHYPYYTIRAQDTNARKALKRQQSKYTEVIMLLDLFCHPNTKTFYVRIKDDLKKRGVKFNMCEIDISQSEITEEDLKLEMMRINDEKKDV
jgi:FtsZ-binding cell division protein ZapB